MPCPLYRGCRPGRRVVVGRRRASAAGGAAAELREGNDDYADFYCATIEWEWGDGTYSENTSDCNPYEAGKSTIQRRFSAEHIFRQGGVYRIVFRLKQKTRSVGSAITNVQVRSGAGEGFGR